MTEGISSVSSSMYSELFSSTAGTEEDDSSSKTTQEIITELQQSSTSSSLTTKSIVDDYGVSYAEAQKILDKIQGTESETEEELPEDSTVSFKA